MFTGIIQEVGTVDSLRRSAGVLTLSVHAPKTAAQVQPMESVAVNGVCLSVMRAAEGLLEFELIPETQHLTTLGQLRSGSPVNLEPSLSVLDRFNGHVVLGHVDGAGTVTERRLVNGELVLTIRVPRELAQSLVPKGPVTVDGVSLTVGRTVSRGSFAVHLIPETLRRTTLSRRAVGDLVNIEVDYFAKLLRSKPS